MKFCCIKVFNIFPNHLIVSNYATKADSKGAAGADRCILAAKSDLVSWKTEVDKIGTQTN